jgi:hypothetical protein
MYNKYLKSSNNNQKNKFNNLYDKYKYQNNKKTENNFENKEYNIHLNTDKNRARSQYKYGSKMANQVYYDKYHF